jgi:o-succinylbenzoate synthase
VGKLSSKSGNPTGANTLNSPDYSLISFFIGQKAETISAFCPLLFPSQQTNMYTLKIIPRTLHFKQPAGTSRGVYHTRQVWYLLLTDTETGQYGVGECAPLPALSCDDLPDYPRLLDEICEKTAANGYIDYEALRPYPSILFGLETAFAHLQANSLQFWDTPFSRGEQGIPINGLIWMGNFDEMYRRIEEKMKAGFRCIKVKIGAIEFERELELLAHIRHHFSAADIELRVDANGAFSPEDALRKLTQLNEFQLHSIEQPVRAGQWEVMKELCATSPFPIALDEELIGVNETEQKIQLLDTIRPQYIILKPSLHGGIQGSKEWITLAQERGIGYWVTSALESNIGLNAIAQWCATLQPEMPQGLGTGMLFTDNIDYPLHIEGDCLWFHPEEKTPDFPTYLQTI